MVKKMVTGLLRWRWLLVLLSLIGVAFSANGMKYVTFASDYEYWFSKGNPQLEKFLELQKTYDKSDNVIFLLTPKEGDVFTPQTLASIQWLTKEAWQTPFSTRVDSLTNFQHTYAEEDDLIVEDLVTGDPFSLSEEQRERIETVALNEPLLLHRVLSKDGQVTAVNVTINLPKNKPEGSPTVAAFARDLSTKLVARDPNLEVRLTGLVMMDNAFTEAALKDMGTLTPLMFAIILLGLVFFLKSLTGTLITLVVIMLSIVVTMGTAGYMGVKLTPVSANAPVIVLTVVVAHAVHILVSLFQQMRLGVEKGEALFESLRINMQPVFLATVTTIIGFLSMNFSEVPPFRDLGNSVSAGVVAAFILSFTLLPTLILLLPFKVKEARKSRPPIINRVSAFVVKKYRPLLWSVMAFAILVTAFLPTNTINEEIYKYFDKSVPFRLHTDYASENLTGPYHLEYSLKTGREGGVSDPLFLKSADDFKKWLQAQPEVIHVQSITDTFKRLNMNLHGDDPSWYRLPDNKELAAQYLLLYEMSLPYGLDLTNQLNVDKSSARLFVSLKNLSTTEMIRFKERSEGWILNKNPSIEATVSSPLYMFSHIVQRTVKNMGIGLSFALVLISLILMVALRSIKMGLVSLIPNLLPAGVAFGLWAIFQGEVGFALAVGAGMTLGIVVDDTVHFLSKYLRARKEKGLDARRAVEYAFSQVGAALVITTVVLVVGFVILTFSTFRMNVHLGAITAMTIATALFLDFLLLPALLIALDRKKKTALEEVEGPVAGEAGKSSPFSGKLAERVFDI